MLHVYMWKIVLLDISVKNVGKNVCKSANMMNDIESLIFLVHWIFLVHYVTSHVKNTMNHN